MSWRSLLKRGLESPHLILYGICAVLNGYYYKFIFLLTARNIKIGKYFRVIGKFHVVGSGRIVIGNNCMMNSKLFKATCFMPVNPESSITIGDNVTFSGTSIQCFQNITIDDNCAIANAYIVDSPGHHLTPDRKVLGEKGLQHAPVKIGKNVWISANTVVTHGVTIGENSVIAACALVRKDVEPNSLYAGVPAKFIKKITTD